ncbi:unnamed protein product [Lactuca virosa]|uniref:Uncharacterized protein n=1 Tax=Lactuca virosa TaxID=75947 RepID=A0AAU9N2H5_9ASTR|nr:unnamed protein product [Lactuca virosa]
MLRCWSNGLTSTNKCSNHIILLRKQKRKYGEAFVKHELENKNKVESCRRIKSLTGMNQRASNKLFTQFHRGCS